MPRYRVVHTNKYWFSDTVSSCALEARLQPYDNEKQVTEFSQIVVRPLAKTRTNSTDIFGNHVSHVDIKSRLQSIELTAIHTVNTMPTDIMDLSQSLPWELAQSEIKGLPELAIYSNETPYVSINAAILNYAQVSFTPNRPLFEATFDLMQRLFHDFQFDPQATDVNTTAVQAFNLKRGVCQDFAHVAIACLRSLKLGARYVSGYVDTKSNSTQPNRIAADVSHAWFSVYDPSLGWADFDPTNNKMPDEFYIVLAYGCDYNDIIPLKGVTDCKGNNQLSVNVDLTIV